LWYLPSEGIGLKLEKSYRVPYKRFDFKNMLERPQKQVVHLEKKVNLTNASSINNMILSGLYGNKHNGFAIIAKKSSPSKTTIVAIGEKFEGYELQDILQDSVVFSRTHKEYVLKLTNTIKQTSKHYYKRVKTKQITDNEYAVDKKDINFYSQHPSEIWKDIAISEVRKRGKIIGFRVNRIRRNSKMAEIGLRVGDLIIRANNVELQSYRDAMKLYNDIDKIDTIDLVVMRNNQEKEIVYEIR
jgi:general secretion pathway protein C